MFDEASPFDADDVEGDAWTTMTAKSLIFDSILAMAAFKASTLSLWLEFTFIYVLNYFFKAHLDLWGGKPGLAVKTRLTILEVKVSNPSHCPYTRWKIDMRWNKNLFSIIIVMKILT